MSTTETRAALRRWEIADLIDWFPETGRILELGAGDGAQAAELAARGFTVTALEIASDNPTWQGYQDDTLFLIELYDGRRIPYPDKHFDLVFSSQLLEHVADVQGMLKECRRVGGRMVMVIPTFSWRLWSIFAYYPARLRQVLTTADGNTVAHGDRVSLRAISVASFFPSTHGEKGNVVTELVWFSRWRWRSEFRNAGLVVLDERPIRLFATGEWLTELGVRPRRFLARLLGSTRRAFLVAPPQRSSMHEAS